MGLTAKGRPPRPSLATKVSRQLLTFRGRNALRLDVLNSTPDDSGSAGGLN